MTDASGQNAPGGNPDVNRMRWRCRRGMRELDVLLMRFVDAHYAGASAAEQAAFQQLLSLPDPEIVGLLMAAGSGDDPAVNRVVSRLLGQQVP
jgi:antitoxin CptB